MAVSRWIEARTGWSIRKFVKTARRCRTIEIQTGSSRLNRIEAQVTALRYFALDGTDHASHQEQASMIRRYITWRNNHA